MNFKFIFPLILAVMLQACQADKEQKFAFVNNQEVYSQFELTKELQGQYNTVFDSRKKLLDSMEVKISGLSKKVEIDHGSNKEDLAALEMYKEEYMTRKTQMENEGEILNQKYQQQILTQLNSYLKEFGKTQGLTMLFGANGNGDIMYADSLADMTKPAVTYINNKYKGKN